MLLATALINQLRSLFKQIQQLGGDRKFLRSHIFWIASRSVVVASTLVTSLCLGIQQFGGLEALETMVFDRFVQLQPDTPPDSRLLVVAITEQDLKRYGWPLSDQILAQTLSQIQSYQPQVIGLDLYRDIPKPPGEVALATQLQAKNLIVITEIIGGIPPPPKVEDKRVGFNDLILDLDGVVRRNLLFVGNSDQGYYSFALRVSLAYLKNRGVYFRHTPEALLIGEIPILPLEPTSGGYQKADTRGYQILLDYRARSNVALSVTLSQVLNGEVNPDWVRGKIVLIGTTAPSLKDLFYTPYSSSQHDAFQMPGVIIHAQMISQLLDVASGKKTLFRFWNHWGEMIWLWSWTVVGGVLVWWLKHPAAFGLVGILCFAMIGGTGWLLLGYLMIWIPVAETALGFVGTVSLAMAHRLIYITNHDPLTGLLNRGSFVRYLRRSLTQMAHRKARLTLGVMFLDLDRIQLINKTLGYQIGDHLLLEIITRLRLVLPQSARLARIGGNEVAISLEHSQKEPLTALADQLHDALAEPFLLNHQSIVTAISIGIAIAQEGYSHTPENLLRDAHTAMYRAKAMGKDRYQVFAAGMLQEAVDQFVLENDLRQGITAREFVLYYQPIVALSTGKVAGFEALVRWQHPQKGFISPITFIPLAEETGLIIPLGKWICEEACRQARQWEAQFSELQLILSINLSGRQFEQPDLIDQLAHIVREAEIEKSMIKFEVTESMVMGDVEAAIDLMLYLKSLGFKLSMDDFGTGYSSLSHLRRFPVDTLKVDKSFVQKMGESQEDYEIVRMIVTLGHALGMDLVAEGIETKEDAEALRSLGCEFGQGYFWAKPLPPDAATALIQKQVQ